MRTRSRITVRQLVFSIAFLVAFLLLVTFLFTYHRDEHLFENITTRLFRSEMESNTLNMHYTIAYPDNFGIHNYKAVLPCYSSDNRLSGQAGLENLISALSSLNADKLSEEDQYARNLLLKSLSNSLSMSNYPYFEEPLSPSSGMQVQLPILLAEYTFRTEQDVADYLRLLDQTDEYFSSLLAFEQEKASQGLLMASSSLQKVIDQCDTVLDKTALEEESHFLQSTFRERITCLIKDKTITLEKAKKYVVLNNRLLRTVMQPAYEALADGLCLLLGNSGSSACVPSGSVSPGTSSSGSASLKGLAAYENGAEYYSLLLRSQTGSDRNIPEIEDLLLSKLSEETKKIAQLVNENEDLSDLDYEAALADAFPYRNASQMLTDLQQRMQNDFPAINPSGQKTGIPQSDIPIQISVKPVSKSLENYCAPAFFLTPPIDDATNNVIYLNGKNSPSSLELYTTLAHEGYPGHLYQTVYYNQLQNPLEDISAASLARQLLWYGGYLEGWALYVEFLSFDYASQILLERDQPQLSAAVQIEKHNRSMLLCLYTLIDILIHYENASLQQVGGLLDSVGITDPDAAAVIYEYIVENPANYPKYYLGYLEILALKKQAEEQWQDSYTDCGFHTFFLNAGPSDFFSLQELLKASKNR